MKELSREKRQEVVQHYILGCSYEEITRETGVSHGTVANIIREVDNGQLAIPGSTFDQVNDLRQLSLDLKKKRIEPSQAQLGLLLFEKFRALGITPEMIDKWAELTKRFTPVDFPARPLFSKSSPATSRRIPAVYPCGVTPPSATFARTSGHRLNARCWKMFPAHPMPSTTSRIKSASCTKTSPRKRTRKPSPDCLKNWASFRTSTSRRGATIPSTR